MSDFSNIGKQIGETIEQVMNSKEVNELKSNLKTSINSTIDEVRESITGAVESTNESLKGAKRKDIPYAPNASYSTQNRTAAKPIWKGKSKLPVIRKPRGKVKGMWMKIGGSMGSIIFAVSSAVLAIRVSQLGLAGMYAELGFGFGSFLYATPFLLCLSVGGALRGNYLINRAKRFQIYIKALEEKPYCSITQLAQLVNKKEKYVIRDLNKMMRRNWFFEGHLDEQNTCFIATDEAYLQYQDMQRARLDMQRKEEEEEAFYQMNPEAKELLMVEEEGNHSIDQIREMNELIQGKEISEKLDRLELVCRKIFDYVKEHPAKLSEISKFMNYYLPTTLKLISTYHEFDIQPVQGENILKTKREIEVNMDDINKAFENLLDQLFQEKMLDISTEISVLSTMLTQEGLMESDFK